MLQDDDNTYYARYGDGTQSNSIIGLNECRKWLEYYRSHYPNTLISIVDVDGYIVPGYILWGRSN